MSFHHGPPNQPPSWGYHCDTPMPLAPTGVPNASSGQMLMSSRSTRTHPPAPLTRSHHLPPVSAQQHLPPSAHAHSTSYSHQLDAGALPSSSSSGYYLSPRSQNTPHIPAAPVFACQQKVKARITSNAWVIGIIVSILDVASKFTGVRYTVEYELAEGSGRSETRVFSVEDLRPYWPQPECHNMSR